MNVNEIKVTMTVGDINEMLRALGKAPLELVLPVFDTLRNIATQAVRDAQQNVAEATPQ